MAERRVLALLLLVGSVGCGGSAFQTNGAAADAGELVHVVAAGDDASSEASSAGDPGRDAQSEADTMAMQPAADASSVEPPDAAGALSVDAASDGGAGADDAGGGAGMDAPVPVCEATSCPGCSGEKQKCCTSAGACGCQFVLSGNTPGICE